MSDAPKRRWLRFAFSLRTLFIAVTLFGVWLWSELRWIQQRQELLARQQTSFTKIGVDAADLAQPWWVSVPRAPGLLWLFGERGVVEVDLLILVDKDEDKEAPLDSFEDVKLAKRLFPEAKVEAAVFTKNELDPDLRPLEFLGTAVRAAASVINRATEAQK